MKKIVTSVMLLCAFFAASPANAKLLRFGIETGYQLNKLTLSKELLRVDNQAGFFIGPKVQCTVPLLGLGLDGALHYSQKNLEIDNASKKIPMIAIPLNVRYTVGFSSLASVYLATGPEFEFNMGDNNWNGFELNKSNLNWNVDAGITLLNHLQLGVEYSIGLGNYGVLSSREASDVQNMNLKTSVFAVKSYIYSEKLE